MYQSKLITETGEEGRHRETGQTRRLGCGAGKPDAPNSVHLAYIHYYQLMLQFLKLYSTFVLDK